VFSTSHKPLHNLVKLVCFFTIIYDAVYSLKEADNGQTTELQLNSTKLSNIKNSSIKVIVNSRLNMLSRSYTHVNVDTVRGTQHSLYKSSV